MGTILISADQRVGVGTWLLLLLLMLLVTTLVPTCAAFRPTASSSRVVARCLTTHHRMSSFSLEGKTTCVSVDEAIQAHVNDNTKYVDGSWFLKDRNGRAEFEAGPRIQGAVFFDINDVALKDNPKNLPHMMPTKELFAAAMDAMGISNDNHIVLYGTKNCLTTHRAWFQIRAMGHAIDKLHLMQGNLSDWIDKGGPTEEGEKQAIQARDLNLDTKPKYQAMDARQVVDIHQVMKVIEEGPASDYVLVDVRAQERFLGQVEEPRPNMRLGHMPGAINLPFGSLLDPNDVTRFKSTQDLQALVERVPSDKQVIISCGSGATACALVAALELCGRSPEDSFVYDGSWAEWGGEADTPIVKED